MGNNLKRRIEISPAYDKRSEGYGIGSCILSFYLIGKDGAIQFKLLTGWFTANAIDGEQSTQNTVINASHFMPADLGYHSRKPMYDGHQTIDDNCPIIGGKCYYDGSGLAAYRVFDILVSKGSEGVWSYLEDCYYKEFNTG